MFLELLPIIKELLDKYQYLNIDLEDFIKEITGAELINLTEINDHLEEYVKNRMKETLENADTAYKLIEQYIDYIYSDNELDSFNQLDKLVNFLTKNKYKISEDLVLRLIRENVKFTNILNGIVSNVKFLNRVNNNVSIYMIDIYSEYKEKELYLEENNENDYMTDGMREYLNSIGKIPLLSQEEEKRLAILCKEGDKEARNKLIQSNLRFVVGIAKKYHCNGLDLLDLIQEGNLGLIDATRKFDPEKGFRFTTYSYWWIKQKILRALVEKNRSIRLPADIYFKVENLKEITNDLRTELGREPTIEDISKKTNIPVEELIKLHPLQYDTVSMETLITDSEGDDGKKLEDYLSDKDYSVENIVIRNELDKKIYEVLKSYGLTDKQVNILMLRSGFDGEVRTLEYIGKKYGVSRERIRQSEAKALDKIRYSKNIGSIAEYSGNSEFYIKKNLELRRENAIKEFYDYFNEYTIDEINDAIDKLSEDEKKVLNFIYSKDTKYVVDINFVKLRTIKYKIKHILNPDLEKPKRVVKRRSRVKKDENKNKLEDQPTVDIATKEKENKVIIEPNDRVNIQLKMLEVSKSNIFNKLKTIFTNEQAFILVLSLGYIDYRNFTNAEIAEILSIDEERVQEILSDTLTTYKKNIDRFIDEVVIDAMIKNTDDNKEDGGKKYVKKQ